MSKHQRNDPATGSTQGPALPAPSSNAPGGASPGTEKRDVLAALRARISARIATLTDSQRATQAGATHEESRPENAKDTRATEASYLARGLAERVATLRESMDRLAALKPIDFASDDPIGLGALVGLEDESGAASTAFLVPAAGGETLTIGGARIQAVTPGSPLGRSLIGGRAGDDVEVRLPAGASSLRVCWVR